MVKDVKTIKNFYTNVMNCKKSCPFISRDDIQPPRGFWFNEFKNNKILVIGLNPGKFNENSDEWDLYTKKQSLNLVETHMKYVEKRFSITNKNFQRNLLKALDLVIGLSFKDFDFSNLVKCSTEVKWEDIPKDNREELMKKCFETHLKKELNLLNPKIILAYGNDVFNFLHSRVPMKVINLPRPGRMIKKNWTKKCLKLKEALTQSEMIDNID